MKKFNIDETSLSARIEDLISKRIVRRGMEGDYTVPQSPRFFPRMASTPKLRELWYEFFHSGDYPEIHIHSIKERWGGTRSHKIIPARQALLASPGLKKEDILWYEDMEQIFRRAKGVSQNGLNEDGSLGTREQGGCGCRRFWAACDTPGGCTSWQGKPGEWGLDTSTQPGFFGRECSVEEALAACNEMEDFGQVHISPNTAQITSTCNCCECCCEILHGMKYYGDIYQMLSPSRFRAVIDEELCKGCQTCIERCHFDAIELRKVPDSKKMKAFIINEHCMGCGVCIFRCPNEAMSFELVRPPEYIPTTPFGRR